MCDRYTFFGQNPARAPPVTTGGVSGGPETCVDTTAKLRPQASVLALRAAGANQLLRPESTTPRSYGRRHRPWHHGHVNATRNERRRGKRPAHHHQVHAWRPGHRPGHHNQVPAAHNERRRGLRPGTTIKYLRGAATPSGAAGSGLGITANYLRGAASIGLGATTK